VYLLWFIFPTRTCCAVLLNDRARNNLTITLSLTERQESNTSIYNAYIEGIIYNLKYVLQKLEINQNIEVIILREL
jgi:hypothetical protein